MNYLQKALQTNSEQIPTKAIDSMTGMKDKKIKTLIIRHVNLLYQNNKKYSSIIAQAIDRIEQEYILLTGYEIRDNKEHKKLINKFKNL